MRDQEFTGQIAKLYHEPCRHSGMGFLVPDLKSPAPAEKFMCMNCGKRGISMTDEGVIQEVEDLYSSNVVYVQREDDGNKLLINGEQLIAFEGRKQAVRFLEDNDAYVDCVSFHFMNEDMCANVTNGYPIMVEYIRKGDNEDGKEEE